MIRIIRYWIPVLSIVLISSWALFHSGFFRVHDYTHAARISELLRSVQAGHIPPRWTENFGFGYGMPLYVFYAPLPYYVGAFLRWTGLSMSLTLKLVVLIATLGTAWAGYGIGKSLTQSRFSALVSSAAITLFPYRAVNIYVRGAFSEVWGLMGGAILLYGSILFLTRKQRAEWVVVLGTVILLLSHNLTTLILIPFIALWSFLFWFITEYFKHSLTVSSFLRLLKLGLWYLLGLLVSSYYVLPAFLEKGATQLDETIVGGYFDYSLHFLYIRQFFTVNWKYGGSSWGPTDDISFFLGWGQLLLLLVLGIVGLRLLLKIVKKRAVTLAEMKLVLAAFFLGTSLFMTLLKSKVLWDAIPLLAYIQFPWRYLSAVAVFIPVVIATVFSKNIINNSIVRNLLLFVILIATLANVQYFRPESYLATSDASFDDYYYEDPTRIKTTMSSILPDYIPDTLNLDLPPAEDRVSSDADEMSVLVDDPHQVLVSVVSFDSPSTILFNIADFPGWTAYVDRVKTEHVTTDDGLIEVTVPPKGHQVGVVFQQTQIRKIADFLSLVGLAILVWFGVSTKHLFSKGSSK